MVAQAWMFCPLATVLHWLRERRFAFAHRKSADADLRITNVDLGQARDRGLALSGHGGAGAILRVHISDARARARPGQRPGAGRPDELRAHRAVRRRRAGRAHDAEKMSRPCRRYRGADLVCRRGMIKFDWTGSWSLLVGATIVMPREGGALSKLFESP